MTDTPDDPKIEPVMMSEPLSRAIGERYLTYALSTIMHRALPDARDGLKPVHRRILFAMRELKLSPAGGFRKSASFTPSEATEVTALALPLVQPVPAQATPAEAETPDPAPQAEASAKVWYVDARSVNVRMGPSTDDAILGRLTHGEAATVLGIDNTGWAHIVIEGDGMDGYVSSEFLTPTDPNGN